MGCKVEDDRNYGQYFHALENYEGKKDFLRAYLQNQFVIEKFLSPDFSRLDSRILTENRQKL